MSGARDGRVAFVVSLRYPRGSDAETGLGYTLMWWCHTPEEALAAARAEIADGDALGVERTAWLDGADWGRMPRVTTEA